ncbi:uncharacterized protein APUU_60926S [Aspergillus puulaauensis]|uniref:F-box domain-containing protein n=1 Tax=Aspergillus puulaauensis TaxID=1220207 RepID=A0A7R8ASF7_9EURO|nr:uncharacterized protein APUU_60926S [Aspergillus puulaauensis]BCS27878.1 hypothetical protein APUU_60926S [Aspergillus puulaauensis]
MAFDCYCAICGVGFSGMRIGSPSDVTAARRQQYVDSVSRATTPLTPQEDESIYSYDPRLVDSESVVWTSEVHCLGVHDVQGKTKAFVSGPGYYADAGELAVKMGQRAKRTYFNCYGFGTDEAPGPVVPFHWCCFQILLRSLTGSDAPKDANLDVLYDAMMSLCNVSGSALRLAYGDHVAHAQGQYWQCLPGTEYSVRHPTGAAGFEELARMQIETTGRLRAPSKHFDIGNRQPRNPFGALPAELVYQICSFLPGESLKSLIQASAFIHLVTQDDYFWRCFIQSDMPWLWEKQVLRQSDTDLNHKQVYIWLDAITAPKYGLEDATLMGIANRRRIWGACDELSRNYKAQCQSTE